MTTKNKKSSRGVIRTLERTFIALELKLLSTVALNSVFSYLHNYQARDPRVATQSDGTSRRAQCRWRKKEKVKKEQKKEEERRKNLFLINFLRSVLSYSNLPEKFHF